MFGYKEFASLNRWVLNWDVKVVMESDCLMCWGRAFQSLGAEKLKVRAPMVLRLEVGMVSSPAEGGGRVFIEEVAEVIGGWTVESFIGAEKGRF